MSAAAEKKRRQRLNMTQDKLLQSNDRARLQKMTARLGMSQDDKAKMREKETIGRKSLRDGCLLMKRQR